MAIAPVSGKSNVSFPLSNDNGIKQLEKQKIQLQEQIQKTNESKLDHKSKQERVKQLQEQIQQIDVQIQQKRTEKLNENQETNQQAKSVPSVADVTDAGSSLAGMSHLIQASTTYSQSITMNKTKNSLVGKGKVLESEIKFDEKNGNEAKSKRAELQKIQSRERMLDQKTGETTQAVQNQVNKAAEAEGENSNREVEGKNPEANDAPITISGTDQRYKRVDIRI
ncbi:FlxA-like family protein [Paenibacillus sp. MBLB4367]|uniref:FlxA-like family protein n=1 Tax=Paenibacillus sp. MBLB4367 TaxID=3384767 RepID=UPI00390818AA